MQDGSKIALIGTALVALSPLVTQIADAATGNVQVRAAILKTIALSQVQSLDFGTFSVTGAGGTVLQRPSGSTLYTGLNEITGSSPSQAIVKIKATAGYNVAITVTNPTATISNGAQTMKIDSFQLNTNAGGIAETIAMTATTAAVPIGATLHVNAGQAAGTYTGTFTVQAVYQ